MITDGTVFALFTGSRKWTVGVDDYVIHEALAELGRAHGRNVVLVHGGQGEYDHEGNLVSGADMIAAQRWAGWGLPVEMFAADWADGCDPQWPGCTPGHRRRGRRGEFCPEAGFRRNQRMVDMVAGMMLMGAPVMVLACPHPRSRSGGTWDCVRRARAAGIVSDARPPWVRNDLSVGRRLVG